MSMEDLCKLEQGHNFFQIKTFYTICKCPKLNRNRIATSTYLAERYMDEVRDDPNFKVKVLKKRVKRDLELDASRQQLYRAKHKAMQHIDGDGLEQFNKLWDYTNILL